VLENILILFNHKLIAKAVKGIECDIRNRISNGRIYSQKSRLELKDDYLLWCMQ
jgi:hypothetical protein